MLFRIFGWNLQHCYDDVESILNNARVLKCELKAYRKNHTKTKSHVSVVILYQSFLWNLPKIIPNYFSRAPAKKYGSKIMHNNVFELYHCVRLKTCLVENKYS